MTPPTPVFTGGCQCGRVRYALLAEPHNTHLCHCRMCQKAMGNAFAAFAVVTKDALVWTRGEPAIFRSSSIVERGFCAACGTPLTFGYVDSGHIDVTIGSLDEPERAAPVEHLGVEARLPWLKLADDLPTLTTERDSKAELLARIVSYQHPDHDTPEPWIPPGSADDR